MPSSLVAVRSWNLDLGKRRLEAGLLYSLHIADDPLTLGQASALMQVSLSIYESKEGN